MTKSLLFAGAIAGVGAYALAGKVSSKFTGPEVTSMDTIKNYAIVYGAAAGVGAAAVFVLAKVMRVA